MAVHVNHRLQTDSDHWQEHCQQQCQQWHIPFQACVLESSPSVGESLEAWAREQRYQQFQHFIKEESVLMTAHHQGDQLETVLLQLFRGAGPEGIAAMPGERQFGNGKLLRPLLDVSRTELEDYAHEHNLQWIDDPSNKNIEIERNYLRHEVIPLLEKQWPAIAKTVSRSAHHIAAMNHELIPYLEVELHRVRLADSSALDIRKLETLNDNKLFMLIRLWLQQNNFDTPTTEHLRHIKSDVMLSAHNAQAEVRFANTVIRKYRNGLYAMRNMNAELQCDQWDLQESFKTQLGELKAIKTQGKGIKAALISESGVEVRYRQGGEKMRVKGHTHTADIKKLMQEAAVLPWYRTQLPFIYIEDELALIPGFWLADKFSASADEASITISWNQPMDFLTAG